MCIFKRIIMFLKTHIFRNKKTNMGLTLQQFIDDMNQ